MVSLLSRSIAHRELAVVRERLSWSARELEVEQLDASGPGNVLRLELHHASGSSVVTAFGERGVRAEQVADRAVDELGALLAAEVPVDGHLADQLLIPLALAGGGSFRTVEPTLHTRTNAWLVQHWLPVDITFARVGGGAWEVEVTPIDDPPRPPPDPA